MRKSRLLVQKGRVDDALDLKKMAELQEENLSLQSEVKKLRATNSKLKIDVKEVKINFETDLGRCEAELEKAQTLIKELKAEIRQKEEIFEREVESLEKRARKQMAVVKSLKAQVKNSEEQVKIDRKGFEDVISKNEFDKYEQVKALQKTLETSEAKYAKELHSLKDEISRSREIYSAAKMKQIATDEEVNDLKEKLKEKEMECSTVLKEHQGKMRDSQLHYDQTLTDLSRKLEEQTVFHQRELLNFTEKLKKKDEEVKSQSLIVDQLRAYIGENLPNTQLEKLQTELEEAKQAMTSLIQENENLRSTVELLNVRLSSINEILSIQEKELMKFQGKSNGGTGHDGNGLLTKWREKVFALLIQLKSQEVLHEKEERNEKTQLKHLMTELEESQKEVAKLTHILADKKAEQQIEVNRNLALERQLEKCQKNEKTLSSFISQFQMCSCSLQEVAQKTESFIEHVGMQMEEAFKKLATFSQRISFASGRVQFLQGLITHREAQLRSELSEAVTKAAETGLSISDGGITEQHEASLSCEQLVSEVKQLTKERDHLLAQARKDSETLERKEVVIRAQCEQQLKDSAVKISQLESFLKDERERGAILNDKLQTAEVELSERLETIESLKTEMAKHKDVAEKTLEIVLQAEQVRYTEEFAKLEKQFNDVRREHTKAVVALRQAERQVEREKEKAAEQLALEQKEYEMKLEKCCAQLRHMEKERNMLMATVRQEGFKVPRLKPKEFTDGREEEEKENRERVPLHEKQPIKTSKGKVKQNKAAKSVQSEPGIPSTAAVQSERQNVRVKEGGADEEMNLIQVTSVLKDLQSLSTALLNMDRETDDSQNSL
ncbi:coiled-coil alpha-helical rod protein 1-like [Stylophora pistillata]|nr:coiled-coil alpha-helical rod protein 1-like [Stylophora pistillata]